MKYKFIPLITEFFVRLITGIYYFWIKIKCNSVIKEDQLYFCLLSSSLLHKVKTTDILIPQVTGTCMGIDRYIALKIKSY